MDASRGKSLEDLNEDSLSKLVHEFGRNLEKAHGIPPSQLIEIYQRCRVLGHKCSYFFGAQQVEAVISTGSPASSELTNYGEPWVDGNTISEDKIAEPWPLLSVPHPPILPLSDFTISSSLIPREQWMENIQPAGDHKYNATKSFSSSEKYELTLSIRRQ
ncbi:hypothetical protein BO82DRAFT_205763 [Aspergillus uvarum CBS 121591]|uniref:Uncharacterized protein n=1 Tax=Aspergillus uvarum CBS 121591 TaxID=1448315 RepID=A0A319BUY3_9EURO|nr:hypothetical protein BO82DRAFT_205763 [Aspergillus uvarum CBS 121591]PYH76414.1 hypothetical protein BO82DRAFT_205763 [Aspergillus uvarum CBS 121591]